MPMATEQLLPYCYFKGYFFSPLPSHRLYTKNVLESKTQLEEKKVVRILLSNFNKPTLGGPYFFGLSRYLPLNSFKVL